MQSLKECSSIRTTDSTPAESPHSANWGIADPVESCSWASDEDKLEKPDTYDQIFAWFDSNNIKAGNPEFITE